MKKNLLIISLISSILICVVLFFYTHDSYTEREIKVITKPEDQTLTLLAVGDIMLGRHVENLMNEYGDDYPFAHVHDLLNEPDLVIGNLEGPIMSNHIHTPSQGFTFSFDKKVAPLLFKNNIKVVSLANNHTDDYGAEAYQESVDFLGAAGVTSIGHPLMFGPEYIERVTIKNRKFIFVGFNATYPNFPMQQALDFVKNIQKAPDEFLIVYSHAGEEYQLHSNTFQQQFYRGLVDAGADLVLGAHPHVVQDYEVYKNKAIFYSLGNFIFDQYFSKDVQQGLAVKMKFLNNSLTYELIPLKSIRSQPEVVVGHSTQFTLDK